MRPRELEMVKRSYEVVSTGDIGRWLGYVHPDAELHEVHEIPDAAIYRGHEEIRGWAERIKELVAVWEWTPEAVIAEGEDIVVLMVRLSAEGRGSSVPVEQLVFHVLEVRDDKLVRLRGFFDRDQAVAASGLATN